MRPTSSGGPVTIELLERYVANECDLVERAYLESVFQEDPAFETVIAEIRARMVPREARGGEWDEGIALAEFWRRVQSKSGETTLVRRSPGVFGRRGFAERMLGGERVPGEGIGLGSRTLRRRMGVSGLVAAVALMMTMVYGHRSFGTSRSRTYATHSGQQATLLLTDGSRVILAPGTMLRLVDDDAEMRTVMLDSGEAYFDVAHASRASFSVHSGAFTTRVLGTAFLVRYNQRHPRMWVSVEQGKVQVTTDSHRHVDATLVAGSSGDVTDSTISVSAVNDLAPGTEWLRGKMVFHDTPVSVVLAALSRWYGYQFRCSDSVLAHKNVTIALNTRSSAAALSVLEVILRVNLSVVGDTVTLLPHRGTQSPGVPRVQAYDVWTANKEVGR